tara:strand:- start:325 stop:552 length:228 start_codon:yes stop_codon:yes gene_type:complete
MFTVEHEYDYTSIITLDEEGNFEDVEVFLDAEVVYLCQEIRDTEVRQVLELSYQQLTDIVASMNLPEGAYRGLVL